MLKYNQNITTDIVNGFKFSLLGVAMIAPKNTKAIVITADGSVIAVLDNLYVVVFDENTNSYILPKYDKIEIGYFSQFPILEKNWYAGLLFLFDQHGHYVPKDRVIYDLIQEYFSDNKIVSTDLVVDNDERKEFWCNCVFASINGGARFSVDAVKLADNLLVEYDKKWGSK